MAVHDKEAVIESLVAELIEKGKGIPVRFSEIADFPYSTFADLIFAFENREAALLRLSVHMEQALFSMVASKSQKMIFHFSILVGYGAVLAGIVLAALYSWWLFALVPVGYAIGASIGKATYNKTILSIATCSETAFCFLYFIGQVYVLRASDNQRFFHQSS